MSKIDWTDKDEYIKLFYKEARKKDLAKFLDISLDSLRNRAKSLGLVDNEDSLPVTDSEKHYIPHDNITVDVKLSRSDKVYEITGIIILFVAYTVLTGIMFLIVSVVRALIWGIDIF